MFFESIMNLINGALINTKSVLFGDIAWGTLFLLFLTITFTLRYGHYRWTKQYNAEELKKRFFGLGRIMVVSYGWRNGILRVGLAVSFLTLYLSGVTSGSKLNGAVADSSSPLTNIPTGCYLITGEGDEDGVPIILTRKVDDVEDGSFVLNETKSVKVGRMNQAPGTNLRKGNFVSWSQFQGHNHVSQLSKEQVQQLVIEANDHWWIKVKKYFASNT